LFLFSGRKVLKIKLSLSTKNSAILFFMGECSIRASLDKRLK